LFRSVRAAIHDVGNFVELQLAEKTESQSVRLSFGKFVQKAEQQCRLLGSNESAEGVAGRARLV
jgi:hypothetical protein